MRISDWSSDVCSSDLLCVPRGDAVPGSIAGMVGASGRDDMEDARLGEEELRQGAGKIRSAIADQLEQALLARSEEHTSELQSLMRISYAVFCLKKKKHNRDTNTKTTQDQEK